MRAWTRPYSVALLAALSLIAQVHAQPRPDRGSSDVERAVDAADDQSAVPEQPHEPPATALEPADARSPEAQAVLARAEALFNAQNYDGALSEYNRAYQLLAGHKDQFLVLNNLAVCHERMFRYDVALTYYERYLNEGSPAAADRREVEAAVRVLRGLLATLRIASDVSAEVWVDGRPFGNAPAEVLVPAGRHVIELRATLHEMARREITIGARETRRLTFVLAALSNYRGLKRGYFFASAGITAALVVTASVLGARTLVAHDTGLEHAQQSMHLATPDLLQDQARVRQRAQATDLALGGALLFGASSLLLLFLTDWGSEPNVDSARLGAHVSAGANGIVISATLQ